jgi:hypothetical protein
MVYFALPALLYPETAVRQKVKHLRDRQSPGCISGTTFFRQFDVEARPQPARCIAVQMNLSSISGSRISSAHGSALISTEWLQCTRGNETISEVHETL